MKGIVREPRLANVAGVTGSVWKVGMRTNVDNLENSPDEFRIGRTGVPPERRQPLEPESLPLQFLSAAQAAMSLGISVTTFYDWLGQSDRGILIIRGQPVTINYFQGGPQGQGKIRIEVTEVARLNNLMRVRPQHAHVRRLPVPPISYPGITVPLGIPGKTFLTDR